MTNKTGFLSTGPPGWAVLILLSLGLLFYPVHLTLEYSPLQSTIALHNVRVFSFLYYVWFATLLGIRMTSARFSKWSEVALLAVYSVVSQGVWILAAEGRLREGVLYARMIDYLKEGNRISPTVLNFGYFSWPGAFVIGDVASQVAQLPTRESIVFLQFLLNAFFPVLLYGYFIRVGNDRFLAWTATLAVQVGSVGSYKLFQQFHPGTMGLTLLALLLFLIVIRVSPVGKGLLNKPGNTAGGSTDALGGYGDRADVPTGVSGPFALSVLIVAAAVTISHFVSSVSATLILLGISLVTRLGRGRTGFLTVALLTSAFWAGWLLHFSPQNIGGLSTTLARGLRQAIENGLRLDAYTGTLSRNYIGESLPVWAAATSYFWIAVLFILGLVLAALQLSMLNRLNHGQRAALGVVLGLGVVSLISLIAGSGNVIRYLISGPISLMAATVAFIGASGKRIKFMFGYFLAFSALILSLPSFLVNNNSINLNAFNRPAEDAGARFLHSTFGDGRDSIIVAQGIPLQADLPFAVYQYPHPGYLPEMSAHASVQALQDEAHRFADTHSVGPSRIWVQPLRDILDYRYVLGVNIDQLPEWDDLISILNTQNKVYVNSEIDIWVGR